MCQANVDRRRIGRVVGIAQTANITVTKELDAKAAVAIRSVSCGKLSCSQTAGFETCFEIVSPGKILVLVRTRVHADDLTLDFVGATGIVIKCDLPLVVVAEIDGVCIGRACCWERRDLVAIGAKHACSCTGEYRRSDTA